MKKLLTILSLLVCLFVNSQTTVNYTLKDTTGIDTVLRPFTGLNDYFNLNQTINFPNGAATGQHSLDLYFRITWDELSKGWSGFDAFFNLAIDRGEKVIFRIVTIDDSYGGNTVSSASMAYPAAVHTSMQGETNPDFKIGNVWWPNYNSASYLAAWTTLQATVRTHLNNTSRNGRTFISALAGRDIDGIGQYGENHRFVNVGGSFVNNWAWPTGTQWTLSALQNIVNAEKAQFNDVWMLGFINTMASNADLPVGYPDWFLNQSNNVGFFGMRWDHTGSINIWNFEYVNQSNAAWKTAIQNRWKTAPVLGEPIQSGFSAAGQCDYFNAWTEANTYHASMIENANNIENGGAVPTCTANLFRSIAKRMGYRFAFTTSHISDSLIQNGNFSIPLNVENIGIAPAYEHWNWTYELRQGATVEWSGLSTLQLQFYLPGTSLQTDNFTLPANLNGNHANGYNLYLVVRDPMGYRTPLPLQNTGRFTDGSYLLRSNLHIATQGQPPPPPPPPPPNVVPVILIGGSQTDTLPKNTDTLYAQISDANNDTVSYSWTQNSGPNTATIATASGNITGTVSPVFIQTRISGLIVGQYSFRLTANDGKGGITSADMSVVVFDTTVIVPPPPPPPPPVYRPPTIDAGDTIHTLLPKDSVTLTGHVITKDTAIQSVLWTRINGSGVTLGTIVTPSDSTTKVTGLSAGYYLYRYRVTDKAGNIVDDYVYVFVDSAIVPDPIPLPGPPQPAKIFGIKQ